MSPPKRYTRKDLALRWEPEGRHRLKAPLPGIGVLSLERPSTHEPGWRWRLNEVTDPTRPLSGGWLIASGGIVGASTELQAQCKAEEAVCAFAQSILNVFSRSAQ